MNKHKIKNRKFWNRAASRYDKQTKVYEKAYHLSIEKSREYCNAEDQVLEIACGTGIISLGIAKNVKHIVASDISEKMIDVAQEKQKAANIDNINFEVADASKINCPDNYFDKVLVFNLLQLIHEPGELLSEVYRVLSNKGKLLVASDCLAETFSFESKCKLKAVKILGFLGVLPKMKYYSKKEFEELFEKNNFEIIEKAIFHKDPVNYFVAAQKK